MTHAHGSHLVVPCTLLLLALVSFPSRCAAEAVGSPATILKKGQWVFGGGGGAMLERALKGGAAVAMGQLGHFRGYGLTDWLSAYGKVGGAYLQVDDAKIRRPASASSTLSFGAGLLLGGQLKAKLLEHAKTGWELDGSLQYTNIRARHKDDNDGRWQQWTFATSAAKSMGRMKPYVGVRYDLIDFDFKIRQGVTLIEQGTYKEDGRVGAFVGTDFTLGSREDIVLNIETAYVNGTETTLALQWIF